MKSLLPLFLCFTIGFSQSRIGDWRIETSTIDIASIVGYEGAVIGATKGGLLTYTHDAFSTVTTLDGLADISLNVVAYGPHENLWIGGDSPNGFVQLLNSKTFESIEVFDFDLTSISQFAFTDSIALAAYSDGQDVGLLKWLYLDGNWEYSDIYKNFPQQFMEITDLAIGNYSIYIGTNIGLWSGSLDDNLKDPNQWELTYPNITQRVNAMASTGTQLCFSSQDALYKFQLIDPSTLEQIQAGNGIEFVDLLYDQNDGLWGISTNTIYGLTSNVQLMESGRLFNSIYIPNDGNPIIGSDAGLLFYHPSTLSFTQRIPNGPMTNHFTAVKVLDDGRVVCGSKFGLSIMEENGWRNILEITKANSEIIHTSYDYTSFIADTVAVEFGEYISDIEQGPDGRVYCAVRGVRDSIWWGGPKRYGGGVIDLNIDDPNSIEIINSSVLDYYDSSEGNNYQVVMDLEFDTYGNLWVANPFAIHRREPIHVLDMEGDWYHYSSDDANNHLSRSPGSLTFDNWGRLWVAAFQAEEANSDAPNGGLFMLDYYGYVTTPNSFEWVSVIDGGSVWSIVLGNMDRLFYLTPTGLNYYDLVDSSSPVERENPYAFFPNISFGSGSKLRVDYRGNIWALSPTNGIHVLLDNTSPWPDINGLRKENSSLSSDEVIDVDFDSKKGLAYIATSNGLNILRIPFKESVENYSEMKIYPSPFHLPADQPLIVDGLTDESSMMIMALNGHVIRKIPSAGLSSDGYQLTWDGKDETGQWVGSGVYLLSIYDYAGNSQFGKVTVIKH